MHAYDLAFGAAGDLRKFPGRDSALPLTDPVEAGWTGSRGPAIEPEQWPRGPVTGLPMMHALTLKLPPEYRRKGPDLVAISFFQGEGQFAEEYPEPLALPPAQPHPQQTILEDIIGGQFALLWLTEDEFSGAACQLPEDVRTDEQRELDDEGPNAWEEEHETVPVWLGVRTWDPNAGKTPVDGESADGYQEWSSIADPELTANFEDAYGRCHLGGTAMPIQAMPEGLTPYFLELEELPGMNLGGGNLQLDLESGAFDWACG